MPEVTTIYRDAEAEAMGMKRVDSVTGADVDVTTSGAVEMKLSDLAGSDTLKHKAKFTEVSICIQGTVKRAICLISDFFDPAP